MQTSNDVLDAIARKYGDADQPATDYKLAKLLHSNPQRISTIRAGRLYLSKSLALRAAELLEIEPAAVFAIAAADREVDAKLKASLLKMARTALTAAIVVGISAPATAAAQHFLYIMSTHTRARHRGARALMSPLYA